MEYYKKVRFYAYLLVLGTVVVVFLAIGTSFYNARRQIEENLTEVARIIAEQLKATRLFISQNQDKINYTKDGKFEFKHLNPAVVGRGIGQIFNQKTKYRIKQTRLKVRNPVNQPDIFEIHALKRLANESELKKVSGYSGTKDDKMFRYLIPLYIEKSCLQCHGDPKGEIDIAGYPKEGSKLGDLAGAISVSIPVDHFTRRYSQNLFSIIVIIVVFIFIILPYSLYLIHRSSNISWELQEKHIELQELEKKKEELTNMIVHDLKNPLTVIKSGISQLGTEIEKQDENHDILVNLVAKNADRVLGMITELSEIGKLDVNKYPLELTGFSLTELIEAKRASFEQLKDQRIQIKYYLPQDAPRIRADRKLVGRVIDNIINNALKFVPPNVGKIEISVSREPEAKNVLVGIKDNGPGIPLQYQKRIFEKFYQVEKQAKKGDVGLGLAFCRLAVNNMKGKIWVESDGFNGCVFYFTLPLADDDSLT